MATCLDTPSVLFNFFFHNELNTRGMIGGARAFVYVPLELSSLVTKLYVVRISNGLTHD